MARPLKDGLNYFPLNVDIDSDDKFQLIEAKHGITGFGVIIKMFMKIYDNNYYYNYGNNEVILFSKRVNVDINRVNEIINDAIEWGIFDKNLFLKYNILTSNGIQKRYIEAVERRKHIDIIREYWIYKPLSVFENDNINSINVSNNTQSKVKESKGKESIYIYVQKLFLTESEYKKLIDKYGKEITDEKIEDAKNYPNLDKKYTSLYLTLNKWIKKDIEKKERKLPF